MGRNHCRISCVSLFIGGWITARAYGSINRSTAILNGVILWATTLAISSWLLASGVSGTFGLVAGNAGNIANQAQQGGITLPDGTRNVPFDPSTTPGTTPTLSAEQTRAVAENAAKAGWAFTFGSFLALAASIIGATLGARNIRTNKRNATETYQT